MSSPLGPSERGNLQNIDKELEELIKETESGKGNFSQLFHIREELQELSQNKNIPAAVKQKLQEALKDLQGQSGGPLSLANLNKVKSSIDQALKESKIEGPEKKNLG